GNGFRVTVEMTSLLGCSGDDFASILSSLGYRLRRTPKAPAPVAPAEASAETPALEASLDAAAASVEPVDETAPAQPVAEAPAAPEGAIPDAAPAAAVPAEPEFDEVWFPGGRRHNDNRRPEGRGRREGDAEGQQGRRNDRQRPNGKGPRRADGDARPQGGKPQHGKGRDEDRRNRPEKADRPDRRPPREERKPVFDPDSPFAALAALRGKTE